MTKALLCLLLVSLFSCGKNKADDDKEKGLSFGNALSTNRVLTEPERLIGVEACELLRDKREYLSRFENNKLVFDFKGKEQVCGRRATSLGNFTARLQVPSRGPIHFNSSFFRYIDEILTDDHGFFSHYCEKLLNDEVTEIIQEVGGKKIEARILKTSGMIKLEAAWFYPNDDGIFEAYLMDGALIHTKASTTNRRYHGVAHTRAQARSCDDGSVKFVEQELRAR